MADLKIVHQNPAALKPRATNPRTHTEKQIRQIADSIRQFGFTNPVLVDGNDRVIAGHGRVEAAKRRGLKSVPTIRLEDMTEAEIRAYVIADNRLAETAGWDREVLALELQYLAELDLDFDVTITGFEVPEIDLLIGELGAAATEPNEPDPADDIPELDETAAATNRQGDLWIIGKHRLICGDATDPSTYARLLGDEPAQMVFTDPPYNVPIDGHVCGLGSVKHREFAMASGEMSEADFTSFLSTVFTNLARHTVDGAIHYICMDWRHAGEVIAAGKAAYRELKNLCVWAKTNGGCCQSNANWSPKSASSGLSGRKQTPFGQSGRSVLLEDIAAVELAVLVEMIVDRGVSGSELLQGLDVPEPRHRSFSSSKRLV
jgi:hypothetical protein